MRKVAKILGWTALGVVAVAILGVASLLLPPMQRMVAARATAFLAQRFDARAGFENVHIHLPYGLGFDGLYAVDNQGDTLFVADAAIDLKLQRKVAVQRVKITDGFADIKLIASKLRGGGGSMQLEALDLRRMRLKYDTLQVRDMRLSARNLISERDSASLEINDLWLRYGAHTISFKCPQASVVRGDVVLDGSQVTTAASDLFFERFRFDAQSKTFDVQVRNSTLALAEFGRNVEFRELNISALGSVDDFSTTVDFATGTATRMSAQGLWRRRFGAFAMTIDTLTTTADDALEIAREFSATPLSDTLQGMLHRMENIAVSGNLSANGRDLALDVRTRSGLGDCDVKISLSGGKVSQGEAFLHNFDLGRLLRVEHLGRTTAAAVFDTLKAEATIASLRYKEYDYQNITATAQMQNRQFVAQILSRDPNLDFALNWSGTLPLNLAALGLSEGYSRGVPSDAVRQHFGLELRRANLHALHIDTRNAVSTLSLRATGELGGNGVIRVANILHTNQLGTIKSRDMVVHINPERTTLSADLAMAAALMPELKVAAGSSIFVTRENRHGGEICFTAQADSMASGTTTIAKMRLEGRYTPARATAIHPVTARTYTKDARARARVTLTADRLVAAGFTVATPRLEANIVGDTMRMNGDFRVGRRHWQLASDEIIARHKCLKINNLTIESEGQSLCMDGVLSASPHDKITVAANNFDLAPLSDVLRVGHTFEGRASGNALITSVLSNPSMTAEVDLDSMMMDDVSVPPLRFTSQLEQEQMRFLLNERAVGSSTNVAENPTQSSVQTITTAGATIAQIVQNQPIIAATYNPSTREIRGEMSVRNADLSLLDAHYGGTLNGTQGRGDIRAAIEGHIGRGRGGVRFNGEIVAHDYSAKVDYLGVRYAAASETRLRMRQNAIEADSIDMRDPLGNHARMSMRVDLNNLKNVTWDFGIDTDNLLVLSTTHADNDQFYGRVLASGKVRIKGGKQGTQIDVDAATRDGSQFFMPLSQADMAEAEFLTFAGEAAWQPKPAASRARLNLNMALQVEPNALVELMIDPKTGHRVRGRGTGLLNLHVNPLGEEFSIYGNYRINEGIYLFTLENIIEKPFTITPGGTIQWAGNPLDAALDIAATYNLKTSIAAAMTGSGYDNWRMRIPVECRIHLGERLSAPALTFGITAPGATPETQNILSSFLNTEETTATQFFFLLATGNFYDAESGAGSIGAAAGTTTAFDFLSNQLRNLIASEGFNIGIRYRPQTETTSDEWGLDLSQQLWGERLLLEIEGNYDTRNNQSAAYTENMRNLTGDFNLTGIIDKRGTLRAKIFTRTITRFDENQGLQESGAGIYFTEDFNKFGDIFRRWKRQKKREKENGRILEKRHSEPRRQ